MRYGDMFDSSFPRNMQKDIVRVIWHGCEQSFRYATITHARPEAHDVLGHIRRAHVEQELRSMAALYPDTSAHVEWNKTKSAAHTVITRGQFKLTASQEDNPSRIVRPCVFRKEYAEIFQPDFFLEDPYEQRDEESYIFGIILYGCARGKPATPNFVHVVFPDRECETYLDRINLLKKFPDLLDELRGPPVDPTDQPPPPPLFLRINRRAEEDDE